MRAIRHALFVCIALASCTSAGLRPDAGDADPAPMDAGAEMNLPIDAGTPACNPPFLVPPQQVFGFSQLSASGTFHAVVAEVAPDHLVLTPDTGSALTFVWSGPSLAAEFSVGENVSYRAEAGRSFVTSATRTAETLGRTSLSAPIPQSGSIAGGSYALVPECAYVSTLSCDPGTLTVVRTRYSAVVQLGGKTVEIPWRGTAEIGGWRVTNVYQHGSTQTREGGDLQQPCQIEFANAAVLTALGPPVP